MSGPFNRRRKTRKQKRDENGERQNIEDAVNSQSPAWHASTAASFRREGAQEDAMLAMRDKVRLEREREETQADIDRILQSDPTDSEGYASDLQGHLRDIDRELEDARFYQANSTRKANNQHYILTGEDDGS